MSQLKDKLEKNFENACRKIYRNPKKTISFSLIFICMMIYHLPKVTFDTSPEGMLHEDDTSMLTYNRFQEQFGLSNLIVIMIELPEIFNNHFLEKIESFHNELENQVPFVREVVSLVNARNIRGDDDVLYVDNFLKDWRKNNGDIESLKTQLFNKPLYLNHIISNDKKFAALVVDIDPCDSKLEKNAGDYDFPEFEEDASIIQSPDSRPNLNSCALTAEETRELIDAVNRVVKKYNNSDFTIAFAGNTVVVDKFNQYVRADLILVLILVNVIDIILLWFVFRRVSGVVFPNIIVNVSLLSTLGLIAGCGFALSVITTVLPAFLLAVGVADSIHILVIFYRYFDKEGNKEDAICHSMGHSGLSLVMTNLTVVTGFLSFSSSRIADIAEMGIFSAAGAFITLLYTFVLIPAFLAIFPIKRKAVKVSITEKKPIMDAILLWISYLPTKHSKKTIAISFIIFVLSVYGVTRLEFSENLLRMLPDEEAVKKENLFIDRKLRGTIIVEVVVDTKRENGIYDPDILNRIERVTKILKSMVEAEIFVGKVFSIVDVLKEANQALHENDSLYYKIPQDRKTIEQELLLVENSKPDELEKLVDSRFQKTRISIKIPYSDSSALNRFTARVDKLFKQEFQGKAEIIITGLADVMARALDSASKNMAFSFLIAFFGITLMMIFLVGSIKYGLISMIPNLVPIVIVIGAMGFFGVYLDLNSLLIGDIAIGIVVDDTMHFMYNFRKYFYRTGDFYKSIEETFLGTGRAMLMTSIILIMANLCLLFATLESYNKFGFITAVVLLLAILGEFLLAPAILVHVVKGDKHNR